LHFNAIPFTSVEKMFSKILFIEPPKDYWFVMGEYVSPPTGLLILAAYIEQEIPDMEIEILDCQAQRKNWKDVEKYIESSSPSIVATSGFTCNAYACVRTAETAKIVDKGIVTVLGGSHFTFTAEESLNDFPEIDYIVMGEGEVTLVELIKTLRTGKNQGDVKGLSFKHNGKIIQTPPRPLIENLDALPYPAYHLVENDIKRYHFSMMAGKNTRYMILEGARGCDHRCSFCTQWKYWRGMWRTKSAKRIADEIEYLNETYGGVFLWLTDDNFDYEKRANALWQELRHRSCREDIMLFLQARTDDVVKNPAMVAKLRDVGNYWVMLGVENNSNSTLKEFKKGTNVHDAYKAIKLLNDNGIFSHAMFVIGSRKDTAESIKRLRRFSLDLGPDFAIYTALTPFPGTEYYDAARKNGWIEDENYSHYDMVHAIMPTETLSRREVQEELYGCYRAFYGSMTKNIAGVFSKNKLKRTLYRHMAAQSVLKKLEYLI